MPVNRNEDMHTMESFSSVKRNGRTSVGKRMKLEIITLNRRFISLVCTHLEWLCVCVCVWGGWVDHDQKGLWVEKKRSLKRRLGPHRWTLIQSNCCSYERRKFR